MDLNKDIYEELLRLGLKIDNTFNIQEMRNKDGIYLYRVRYNNDSFILKYFENEEYRREIKNYFILQGLEIPTIRIFGSTEGSILLEDLDKNSKYRLAVKDDLSDDEVGRVLAKWYLKLHSAGSAYISKEKPQFYREIDALTRENIIFIKEKTSTGDNKVWELINKNWDLLFKIINSLEETLTYNDFFWTNMAVSIDRKEALMFDYNLLGSGFRYNDIRNVCSSLSQNAAEAFMDAYGQYDEREKLVDEGVADLINLIFACKRPVFPKWAENSLNAVHNGELEQRLIRMLGGHN